MGRKSTVASAGKKERMVVDVAAIVIEKGVPIPQVSRTGKYPIELLGPGDSFLVRCGDSAARGVKTNLTSASRRVTKKTGREFVVVVRPEEQGVRIWRTSDVVEVDEPADIPEVKPEEFIPIANGNE